MIIKLPWVDIIDTKNLPENLEDIAKQSFMKFTDGTREEYRYQDKLLYLDNLRKAYMRNDDTEGAVAALVKERVMYELDEFGTMPTTEEVMSVEFMKYCYDAGFRPFYHTYNTASSSANNKILEVLYRIIKTVMDC